MSQTDDETHHFDVSRGACKPNRNDKAAILP